MSQESGAVAVVRRHLAAVTAGDPTAMAADYAEDAVLDRGERYVGPATIGDYFATVPARLGGATVEFASVSENPDGTVAVRWRLVGGVAAVSGVDTYTVRDDLIVHQAVRLDGADF